MIALFVMLMVLLLGNVVALLFRLRRLIHKIPDRLSTPRFNLVCDAAAIITGTYLVAAVTDVIVSGVVIDLNYSDYAFIGLIILDFSLSVVCAVLARRLSDQHEVS